MRTAARGSVVTVALLLCALRPAVAQPLFSPTQDPLAGSRVFGEKGCVKCHAVDGVGGKVGPDLGRLPRPRSFFDLATAMWNHLPRMAERMRQLGIPRPHLDAREAGDLMAFLFTLNYFDPPGDVQAGRRLFTEKKCVVCHQVGGTGGVVGPNLDFLKQYGSPIFVASAMWNHGPAMAQMMQAKGIARPTFKDTELLDLIAYIKAASPVLVPGPLYLLPGRADEGHRLFIDKRCSTCHGVGEPGRVGPDLAARGVHRSLTQFATAMWNKAPMMMEAMTARGIAIPQISAGEMADLVAYLYAVQYFAESGDVRRGWKVALDKGCLGCHSVHAPAGKAPIDLARVKGLEAAPAVIAALWNHSFIGEQAATAPKTGWAELRPDEMADLVAFLQSLPRPRR